MREIVAARGWDRCVRITEEKRMVKLNVTYRALKSIVLGDLAEARRGWKLLREL
jgi:ribosomal protein L28